MRRTPVSFTGSERTYVRAGACADLRGSVRTGESVGGRLRGQARRHGAGGKAPRRSELPTQRRLLGALPRPADITRADGARAVYGPTVRDALLDDLDPFQHDAVTSSAAPLAIIAPAG